MKKELAVIAALSIAIVSPALAKSHGGQQSNAHEQAQGQSRGHVQHHSANPAYDVYVGGDYAGSDPDPFIRSQLRFESQRGIGD